MESIHTLSRRTLQLDGVFLGLAGGAAMVVETVGHFVGVGPFAQSRGSPYTIGGFEAHGLALILAVLLYRSATKGERREWHVVGTTILHAIFGVAHGLGFRSVPRTS